MAQKKIDELIKLGVDIDEVLNNAKKNKIKTEYENVYGTPEIKKEVIFEESEPQNIQTNYSYYISDNPWA